MLEIFPVFGADIVVATFVGLEAVIARLDLRRLLRCKHRLENPYFLIDPWKVLRHDFAEIVKTEKAVDVETLAVEDIAATQRQNPGGRNIDSRAAKNPHLHGDIVLVYLFYRGGGLHLDEIESAARGALEHIDPDQYTTVLERRFEDCGNAPVVEQGARLCKRVLGMKMVGLHEDAARVALPREAAHFVAGIENCLGDGVDVALELALVTVVPELQVTLAAGEVACFRKTRGHYSGRVSLIDGRAQTTSNQAVSWGRLSRQASSA